MNHLKYLIVDNSKTVILTENEINEIYYTLSKLNIDENGNWRVLLINSNNLITKDITKELKYSKEILKITKQDLEYVENEEARKLRELKSLQIKQYEIKEKLSDLEKEKIRLKNEISIIERERKNFQD